MKNIYQSNKKHTTELSNKSFTRLCAMFCLTLFFTFQLNTSFAQCDSAGSPAEICTATGPVGPFTFVNMDVDDPGDCIGDAGVLSAAYIVVNIATTGNLNLLIDGDLASGFLDVAVHNIPAGVAPCVAAGDNANLIGCNFAAASSGCNQFGMVAGSTCASVVPAIPVTAGDRIIITAQNYSGTNTNFTLEVDQTQPGAATIGPPPIDLLPTGPLDCTPVAINTGPAHSGGGTYSATCGACIDPVTGIFDPIAAGIGTHTVTYDIGTGACANTANIDVEVVACCSFSVTCPAANDLGTFNCTNLNTIPACPADSAAAVAAPYNITIGDMPCGKIEVVCTDDITMYDVCAMGGQTINRTVIIYDDLNDNQMLDAATEESDTCSYVFTIDEDTTPPMIVCATQTTPIDCPAAPVWVDPMVSDTCDPSPMVVFNDVTTPTCGNTFSVTRTWTATDACNNSATCSATIVVQDITPPTIVCAVQTTPIDCPAVPVWIDPTVTDACDPAPMVVFNDVTTPACGNTFSVTRTWTATDACNNSATCSATIVVQDITPPTIVCAVQTTPIDCPAAPVWVNPTVTDACDTAPMVVFNDVTTPACGNTFSVTRTWTATDACNNSSTCSATIVVQDITPPTIVCAVQATPIDCPAVPVWVDPTVTDACDPAPMVVFNDVTTPACGNTFSVTRTWTATDDCNNSATCSATIVVQDITPPVITCPANVIVECDQPTDPGNTGSATATDACDPAPVITMTESSTQSTTGCGQYQYIISRYWTATDACGNFSTCEQTINVVDSTPPVITCPPSQTLTCFETIPAAITNPADFIAAGGTISDNCTATLDEFNIFSVNDDNGGDNCPGNARILIRTYTIQDACGNASTCTQTFTYLESTQDPVITSVLPTCYKYCGSLVNPMESDITYTTDCAFDAVVDIAGPTIIGPENCPGTIYRFTYTVTDDCGRTSAPVTRDFIIGNDGPTIECPSYSLILECGDPNNQSYIDQHLTDVSANTSCQLGYTITHFPQSINLIACGSSTVVTFVVTDACNRTATCTTTVAIQDNTPPEIVSTYIDNVCNEAICGSNLNFWYNAWKAKVLEGLSATDACDSNVSISVSGPSSPNQDCPDETAVTTLTWVASDNCGNTSGISYSFYVVPAQTPAPSGKIIGMVATEESETVKEVTVTLEGNTILEIYETAADGIYMFPDLDLNQNYSVTPLLDENPLNGVSSFDLVLIAKHILQIQQLDSPYKIIAADINKSGSVTTLDLLELRKLILHVNESFPENTSWRFVEAAFVFPEPTNPFATIFPEVVNINGLIGEEQHDFVGVKIGDVNGSVEANAMAGVDDRTFVDDLVFQIADQQLQVGETYEVTFRADNFTAIHGYQFTLNFDQDAMDFVRVREGELNNLNQSNFGLSLLEKGVITTSWTNQKAERLTMGTPLFHLNFMAKENVLLSDVISVGSRYTKAEAYNGHLDLMDVQLRFGEITNVTKETILHQNQPNPFKATTTIGFELPEAAVATLSIYDLSGRMLEQVKDDFSKGYHEVSINKVELGTSGVLYYRLITKDFEGMKKMVIIE